jgi:hypothetical protein
MQFDAKDLGVLRSEQDWKKSEWNKVVHILEAIRKANKDITFAYIFRKDPENPNKLRFIADSHSINPYANTDNDSSNNVDADNNGKFEPTGGDKLQWPGQIYPTPPTEAFFAYQGPTASAAIYEDSWGKYLSGYAPIRNDQEAIVGIIAIDMKATLLDERIASIFRPILYFMGFFLLFVLIRLAAFNRSLFNELLIVLK